MLVQGKCHTHRASLKSALIHMSEAIRIAVSREAFFVKYNLGKKGIDSGVFEICYSIALIGECSTYFSIADGICMIV